MNHSCNIDHKGTGSYVMNTNLFTTTLEQQFRYCVVGVGPIVA